MAELNTASINNITAQLKSINDYIDEVSGNINGRSQDEIDSLMQEITSYATGKLSIVRQSIIDFLKKQYTSSLSELEVLRPIVEANPTDLPSLISVTKNIMAYIGGPYVHLVAFQTEILQAVVTLSSEMIKTSNHTFDDPTLPAINIPIEPISVSDITG